MLKTKCPLPNGSKPHSYEELFSKLTFFEDKIKATENNNIVKIKLAKIYKYK